ncbi:MAG: DNA alkylation repair protein [Methanomicrobiales archaeon]|nr:DNA alkylation repair protein [Methanomicrobiales archaeon]MDD1669151.1 DNA alkylation repair protein [Methanomicrobiales archaeon]
MPRRKGKERGAARPTGVVAAVREELQRNADEATRRGARRFFKEPVTCYGVKTPVAREIAGRFFRALGPVEKVRIFALCEELLGSGSLEEAFIAADWAYRVRKTYEPGDFFVFEAWIGKYIDNWAKCDTLCNHAVGSFIERFPEHLPGLKAWTGSGNRWMRRASAVSLVLPARKGLFLEDILDIAERLLHDEDDLVQKGYGWLLKEAGKAHPAEVFRFVMEHRREMPRTALRYAIEKMPEGWRKQAMER